MPLPLRRLLPPGMLPYDFGCVFSHTGQILLYAGGNSCTKSFWHFKHFRVFICSPFIICQIHPVKNTIIARDNLTTRKNNVSI